VVVAGVRDGVAARLVELLDATADIVTMLERLAASPRASRTPAAAASPTALAELSHAATRSCAPHPQVRRRG